MEALKLLFVPLEGDRGQRQLSIMELLHVSTVRRQSSSVSVTSNGWDGPTGFAMLTHHTGQRMRIYPCISIHLCTLRGGRVVKGQEGAGTEAFLGGKSGERAQPRLSRADDP